MLPAIEGPELCTKCGLCCHGVLHDRAHLQPEELGLAEELGLVAERQNDDDWFKLPCRHVCGSVCSIYERRPKVCGDYECALLTKYKSGAASLDSSLAIVNEAKRLLTELEQVMPEGQSLRDARREWRENSRNWQFESSETVEGRRAIERHLRLTALNVFLDGHFHSDDEKSKLTIMK